MNKQSFKYWILATRPKALAGAIAPVLIATTLFFCWTYLFLANNEGFTFYDYLQKNYPTIILTTAISLLFALIMQIDSNFINDYQDFKKGADTKERLGPKRACAQGWISPKNMLKGIYITTLLAIIIGTPLAILGGWEMIFIGALCILFAFLYSTKFSYSGKGDILVVIFFGIVPVVTVCYILYHATFVSLNQIITFSFNNNSCYFLHPLFYLSLLGGTAIGVVTDSLLMVNNYRDREVDKKSGKNTLVVKYGKVWGERGYLLCGVFGNLFALTCLILLITNLKGISLFQLFLFLLISTITLSLFIIKHYLAYREIKRIGCGTPLNRMIGKTSVNILIFATLFIISMICIILITPTTTA